MRAYRFDHLDDTRLLRLLAELIDESRENTAQTIAVIAEVDRRRLYLPAGYSSMKAYCIEALGLSEDAAFKRIQVAREIDEFPVLLEMLAEGRLHLTGARMVVPHLTSENAGQLLEAVTHKSCSEIQRLLTESFPEPDLLTVSQPATGETQLAARQVEVETGVVGGDPPTSQAEPASTQDQLAARQVATSTTKNLSPRRIPLNLLPETHDKIRYAKELLGHELPSGDDALVVERAMAEMIQRAEKRKLRPGSPRTRLHSPSTNPRHIPKRVKRAVWERDGGQCSFIGSNGHRCGTREHLEFDHIVPVARSGESTVANLRLRCRAHNQFEAERTFGDGYMHEKRKAAWSATQHARQDREAKRVREAQQAEAARQARARSAAEEVVPWLRALGCRADDSRRAAALAESIPDAPLEERVRVALTCFGRRPKTRTDAAVRRATPASPSGCPARA